MPPRKPPESYMGRMADEEHFATYASLASVVCVAGDGAEFACHAEVLARESKARGALQGSAQRSRAQPAAAAHTSHAVVQVLAGLLAEVASGRVVRAPARAGGGGKRKRGASEAPSSPLRLEAPFAQIQAEEMRAFLSGKAARELALVFGVACLADQLDATRVLAALDAALERALALLPPQVAAAGLWLPMLALADELRLQLPSTYAGGLELAVDAIELRLGGARTQAPADAGAAPVRPPLTVARQVIHRDAASGEEVFHVQVHPRGCSCSWIGSCPGTAVESATSFRDEATAKLEAAEAGRRHLSGFYVQRGRTVLAGGASRPYIVLATEVAKPRGARTMRFQIHRPNVGATEPKPLEEMENMGMRLLMDEEAEPIWRFWHSHCERHCYHGDNCAV
eukprot:scaffold26.g3367.t1